MEFPFAFGRLPLKKGAYVLQLRCAHRYKLSVTSLLTTLDRGAAEQVGDVKKPFKAVQVVAGKTR